MGWSPPHPPPPLAVRGPRLPYAPCPPLCHAHAYDLPARHGHAVSSPHTGARSDSVKRTRSCVVKTLPPSRNARRAHAQVFFKIKTTAQLWKLMDSYCKCVARDQYQCGIPNHESLELHANNGLQMRTR